MALQLKDACRNTLSAFSMVVRFLMSATFRNLHCCRAERVFICTFEEIVQVRSSNWKTSGKPNQIRVRLIFTENFTNFVVAVSSPAEDQAVSTLTNFFISTKFSVAKITCFSYALFRLCNQESLTVFPGYLS
jgi:hypothetical protein